MFQQLHVVGCNVARLAPRPRGTPCGSVPQHRRTIAGVRRLLSDFIREVHPDLTPSFPEVARRTNQRSLAQLNAYVDRLEAARAPKLEDGPEVTRELPFFRAMRTRSGREILGRVHPMRLALNSVPVMANASER